MSAQPTIIYTKTDKAPALATYSQLPNISASIPKLKAAIAESQQKGYAPPDFPEPPSTDAEKDTRARCAEVVGSVANPVLRRQVEKEKAEIEAQQTAAPAVTGPAPEAGRR